MLEFGRDPGDGADRQWLLAHIKQIYEFPLQIREGTFSGQGERLPGGNARGNVWFYADSRDVVITDFHDNFVTYSQGRRHIEYQLHVCKALANQTLKSVLTYSQWVETLRFYAGDAQHGKGDSLQAEFAPSGVIPFL